MQFNDQQAGIPGRPPILSGVETACLSLVAEGRRLAEIGLALNLGEAEVETSLVSAERKLGASNRLHAVSLALLQGIVSDPN